MAMVEEQAAIWRLLGSVKKQGILVFEIGVNTVASLS